MRAEVIVTLFIPLTIMMIMLSMGLTLRRRDFTLLFEAPRATLTGAVAQLVALPALGFVIAATLSSTPEQAVGLILLAACPGGPSSNLMTRLAGGDVALSVTLTAISGLVTMLTIPLLSGLSVYLFASHLPELSLPIGETTLRLLLMMGLPLATGMLALSYFPRFAERVEPWVKRSALILMAILILGALLKSRKELAQYGWAETSPPILLSILGIILGLGLSKLNRLAPAQQITLPLEVGAQNAALAIGLALTLPHGQAIAYPAVVYGTFMYLPCGLFILWARRALSA